MPSTKKLGVVCAVLATGCIALSVIPKPGANHAKVVHDCVWSFKYYSSHQKQCEALPEWKGK